MRTVTHAARCFCALFLKKRPEKRAGNVFIFSFEDYARHVRARARGGLYNTQLLVLYNNGDQLPRVFRNSPVNARACVVCVPPAMAAATKRAAVGNLYRVLRQRVPDFTDGDVRKLCAVPTRTQPPAPIRQAAKVVLISHHAAHNHPSFSFKAGLASRAVPSTIKGHDSCMGCLDNITAASASPAYQCMHCKALLCGECLAQYFKTRGAQSLCFNGRESCPVGSGALVGAGLPTSMAITDVVQEVSAFLSEHATTRVAVVYNDSNPLLSEALAAARDNLATGLVYSLCLPSLDGVAGLVKLSDLPQQLPIANCTAVCCVDLPLEVAQCLCTLPKLRDVLYLYPAASVRAMTAPEAAHVFGPESVSAACKFARDLQVLESPEVPTCPVGVSSGGAPELATLVPRPPLWPQGLRITP